MHSFALKRKNPGEEEDLGSNLVVEAWDLWPFNPVAGTGGKLVILCYYKVLSAYFVRSIWPCPVWGCARRALLTRVARSK